MGKIEQWYGNAMAWYDSAWYITQCGAKKTREMMDGGMHACMD